MGPHNRTKSPWSPAVQPIDWYIPGDNISDNLPKIGQINPYTQEYFSMRDGRFGALGNDDPVDNVGGDSRYESEALFELEKQDDSFGSGIFDSLGRSTQNSDTGVFASNYALPGFVAREVPYARSEDIKDINGADVVMVPAGGATFVEAGGRLRSPVPLSRLKQSSTKAMVTAPSGRMQPFVNLTPAAEMLNPTRQWTKPLQKDVVMRSLATDVRQKVLARQNITVPAIQSAALGEFSSLIDSPVKAILWGAVLGVGVGFVVHTVSKKRR